MMLTAPDPIVSRIEALERAVQAIDAGMMGVTALFRELRETGVSTRALAIIDEHGQVVARLQADGVGAGRLRLFCPSTGESTEISVGAQRC